MGFIVSLSTTLVAILVFLSAAKVPSDRTRLVMRAIALLVGILAAISAFFRTLIIVPAGSVGVTEFFGKVDPRSLNPGVYFFNPFVEVTRFSTRLKDVKETIEVTSQEGLAFNVDVSLQYRLNPQQATTVYQTIGTDETEIVTSRFRSIVREITASYPAEAVYSSKRQEVANRLQERLTEQLAPLGFAVEGAFLREIVLPEALQAAVQEKLRVEQESQQMEFTLESARQEAERKRIEAQGIADAQRIIAESTTSQTLQMRAIEATESLANSTNTKVLIIGGSQSSLPTSIQLNSSDLLQSSGAAQPPSQ